MTITSVQINIDHGDLSVNGLSAIVKLKRKKATPRPSQLTGRRYVACEYRECRAHERGERLGLGEEIQGRGRKYRAMVLPFARFTAFPHPLT